MDVHRLERDVALNLLPASQLHGRYPYDSLCRSLLWFPHAPRTKSKKMNRLALLISMVLACSSPLKSKAPDGSSPGVGATGSGGDMAAGGATESAGAVGSGGAYGGIGGANAGSGVTTRSGGAQATGGVMGRGGTLPSSSILGTGGAPVGGASDGGVSSFTGGASGGTSGTDLCADLDYDYCVAECLAVNGVDNTMCTNGAWSCRPGYVLASSCSVGACGATPDACCDSTTGIVTSSPCTADGYRGTCPSGNTRTYWDQAICVPNSLAGATCGSLVGRPCTDPAMGCSDTEGLITTCWCNWAGSDASAGTWDCRFFDGG
jgi:hypothetical protein